MREKDDEYKRIRKTFTDIRQECRLLNEQYTDPNFRAGDSSLGFRGRKVAASWQRPQNIRSHGGPDDRGQGEWKLMAENAHASDIEQGMLGNCWFVAALALIAERRNLLSEIFISRKFNAEGVYALRLFKDGRWQGVIIDDQFPCDQYSRLVFSRCRTKQLWVMLIEKAMAKLHGSYASLEAGQIADGLNYLTGYVSERIELAEEADHDLLWARMLSFYDSEFLMGTSISGTDPSMKSYYKDKLGLVPNHVYSILRVVCMENVRLIQLRNPWGTFTWKGDWSDGSSLWTDHLKDHLSPHRAKEGIFWMCFQDFIKIYTAMEVCKVREQWSMKILEGILPPFADPELSICFQLETEYPTEVDISLYKCSKDIGRESLQETNIGLMVFQTNGLSLYSSECKLVKAFEIADMWSHKKSLTTNLLLSPGLYCLLPFSFGHWTTKANPMEESYYNYALNLHSSRPIEVSGVERDRILQEAVLCYADQFGKKQPISDNIELINGSLGNGCYVTVVNNRTHDKSAKFQMDCKTTGDYATTRGAFSTKDTVNPMHCQVIQVLTIRKGGGGHQTSFQTLVSHVRDGKTELSSHQPEITERNKGLHQPK